MEHLEIEFKMLLKENIFKKYYLIIKIKSKTVINKPIIIFFILYWKRKNTHSELEKKRSLRTHIEKTFNYWSE